MKSQRLGGRIYAPAGVTKSFCKIEILLPNRCASFPKLDVPKLQTDNIQPLKDDFPLIYFVLVLQIL